MSNIIEEKTFDFAVKLVNVCKFLKNEKRENVLSLQLLRSATSIGANVREAERGQSTADFYAKMSIALKEANETEYWLQLLYRTDYLNLEQYNNLQNDINEIICILVSITRTVKNKM